MGLSDTSLEATALQVSLLQAKTTSERLQLAFTLSTMAMGLSRRAIKRACPNLSETEIRCRFVELHYGKTLAGELRQYLAERQNDHFK